MKHLNQNNSADNNFAFDDLAQNVFFPVYGIIADDILKMTGSTSGILIDIGCGGGHLGLSLMQKTAYRGYFVDINSKALQKARERAQAWGLAERAEFLEQDVHQMSFSDGFANLIISRGAYEFWEDKEKAFVEIYRVLTPGGCAYIGAGMGNSETHASICAAMKKIDPDWPASIFRRIKKMSTEEYGDLLTKNNIPHQIIENEGPMVPYEKKLPHVSLKTSRYSAESKQVLLARKWPILMLLPVLLVLMSFSMGKFTISIPDLLHTVYYHFADASQIKNLNMETVLFNIRIPRILTALLVGGGLSAAGAAYQGMFRNPMVSPDIMGASAGAALGASVALLLGFTSVYVQLFAFIGGVIAVFLAMAAARNLSRDELMGLVLAGMMVSTLMQSGSSAVKLLADGKDKLPAITFWLMGSFASVNNQDFRTLLLPVLIGFLILNAVRWQLNVLSFGEDEARSLGVKTKRIRALVIVASTLITAACVSVSGMIGWVGLVIPHLARAVAGPNYKQLLPTCFILGASYLLLVDHIARSLLSIEIPIGILTSIIGVPFFLIIFKRNAKGWYAK